MTTTMKTVIVCSIASKRNDADLPARYTVRVNEHERVEDMLEEAFHLTNCDDRPHGQSVCSTSVGDIFQLDGRHYFVDRRGFKEITPQQSLRVQRMTFRDLCMGWDWLIEHKLIS